MYFSRRQNGFVLRLTYLLLTFLFDWAIFLVALVGLAHLWLPMIDDYKGILEQELSSFVGNQISIGQIRVDHDSEEWRWVLENLQLTEASGQAPIQIRQLSLTVDWRESLRTLRLQPADIVLEGVEFILRQEANALPDVQGLHFPLPGQKNTALNIERQSPIRVSINSGFVHWMDVTNHRALTLSDLQFMGEILPNEITLQADALFPPAIGETLGVDAVLRQVTDTEGNPQWDGTLHTRTRIFNLAALPSPLLQRYGVNAGGLTLDATITVAADKPLHIRGEGEIQHLGWTGNPQTPALQGVNATFIAANEGGSVTVKLNNSPLRYPLWFDKTLQVDSLRADLHWQVEADGWHWQLRHLQAENADLTLQGTGMLALPLHQAPYIDLNMTFATRRALDNVRDYIPAIIPDNTEHWLKTAILSGFVPRGTFVLRGNPADFPFQQKAGEFDIRFAIERGVLAYLPQWPIADDLNGELHFHNATMEATVHHARIMTLTVMGGTVAIPDMHTADAHLLLDLQTQGDLQAHMNYLRDAPIGHSLRDFMQVAEFSGDSTLHLKLDVPLQSATLEQQGVAVDGVVILRGNRFAIPAYGQRFTELKGKVHFDQYGVEVSEATGQYRQQPLKLSAHTDKNRGVIDVELQQQQDPAVFLPESLAGLRKYFSGKAWVDTRLELPAFRAHPTAAQSRARLKVQARSPLQGVAIVLPPPFGKTATEARELLVGVELPFDSTEPWEVKVALNEHLTVQARLPHKGKQAAAIGVGLGGKPVALPANGIRVGGELVELDGLNWQKLAMFGGTQLASTTMPTTLQAEVSVGNLRLGRQSLGKAVLQVSVADILKARLQADRMQASVYLPLKAMASGRVNIDAQHLDFDTLSEQLPTGDGGMVGGWSPVGFPSMRFTCTDCRTGDFLLQSVRLSLLKSRDALLIEQLDIQHPLLALSAAKGRWYTAADGTSHTELTTTATVTEPGKLLAKPTESPALQGGMLTANAQLHWQGSPFDVALAKLNGTLQAKLGSGSLIDVDPGIGRLLGLLDAQRLPTRLALDFRDMTVKGVAFDAITGNFSLDHGVLQTHDTLIEAAAMVAGIEGSLDLRHKTLNHTVTVVPNLRSTLPLVGAALGGVGGGAAMLLFNSLTQTSAAHQVETANGLRYRVTGAWDAPNIVDLKPPFKKTDVDVLTH